MPFERKENSRFHKIARQLKKDILQNKWGNQKLPSIRNLAIHYNTSPQTLLKVLKEMKKARMVFLFEGKKGYFLTPKNHYNQSPKKFNKLRHEEIADLLQSEMDQGKYALSGHLPSMQELSKKFICSTPTLRKTLAILSDKKLITRQGRGKWKIIFAQPHLEKNRVHVIISSSSGFERFHGGVIEFINEMERELQRRNWGSLRYIFSKETQGQRQKFQLDKVSAWYHFRNSNTPVWLKNMGPTDVPGVILDLTGTHKSLNIPKRLRVLHLVFDNKYAGYEMGNHIREMGHKSFTYFSTHESNELTPPLWVSNRWEGLLKAWYPMNEIQRELRPGWVSIRIPNGMKSDTHADIKRTNQKIYRLSKQFDVVPEIVSRSLTRGMFTFLPIFRIRQLLENSLREVLKNKSSTAWVFSNDYQALAAIRFLNRLKIQIPDQIAVCSFDNTPYSYMSDLTTYDFGFDSMAHQAINGLGILMEKQNGIRKGKVKGQLITRGTTLG